MGRAGLRAAGGAAGDGSARLPGPEVSGGARRRGAGCEGDGAARGGAGALDVRRLRHHGARAYGHGVAASCDAGTPEQIKRYLPDIVAGKKISTIAVTEPDAGSDVKAIRTTAKRDGDRWVLNGTKMFITNGALADVVFVTGA